MMFPLREETATTHSRMSNPSTSVWLFLSIEFLIGMAISGFISALDIIKSLLPKPPRDLTGDVVVVAGASSSLGESLAEEFAKDGCSVVCVDDDLEHLEGVTSRLNSWYPRVEEIGPDRPGSKQEPSETKPVVAAYECNLSNREDIRRVAQRVKDEVGRIDVLVTCIGSPGQDIFETANTTLMSHYWTVLAFLPYMLHRKKAFVVGVLPVTSNADAYVGSRAAIAGLMESLGQELGNHDGRLTFLAVSPTADNSLIRRSEQQVAKDVVEAVKRDQSSLTVGWGSRLLYRISCAIYEAITTITQWLHTQGCDYSF